MANELSRLTVAPTKYLYTVYKALVMRPLVLTGGMEYHSNIYNYSFSEMLWDLCPLQITTASTQHLSSGCINCKNA